MNLWLTFLIPFAVAYCSVRSEVVCGFYLFTQLQCEDYSVKVLRASWVKAGFQLFLQESLQLIDFGRKKVFWFRLWSVVWCCGLLFFFFVFLLVGYLGKSYFLTVNIRVPFIFDQSGGLMTGLWFLVYVVNSVWNSYPVHHIVITGINLNNIYLFQINCVVMLLPCFFCNIWDPSNYYTTGQM